MFESEIMKKNELEQINKNIFTYFPKEVLIHILSFLNTSDLFNLSLMSHWLATLTNQNNLWFKHAKIVIATSWGNIKNLAQFKALFSIYDLSEIIDDYIQACDVKLIEAWLDNNLSRMNSFVVINGRDLGLSQAFKNRFVFCPDSSRFSLFTTDEQYQKASNILKQKLPFVMEDKPSLQKRF